MSEDVQALQREILAILEEHGKAVLGQIAGNWQRYAKDIAKETVEYTLEALGNPNDERIRTNLSHLKAQAIGLAAVWEIQAEEAAWQAFLRILEVIFRVATKAALVALGDV